VAHAALASASSPTYVDAQRKQMVPSIATKWRGDHLVRALNPDAFKRLADRSLNEIGIGLQGAIDLHLQVLTSFTP
jgi:hypothetical protein